MGWAWRVMCYCCRGLVVWWWSPIHSMRKKEKGETRNRRSGEAGEKRVKRVKKATRRKKRGRRRTEHEKERTQKEKERVCWHVWNGVTHALCLFFLVFTSFSSLPQKERWETKAGLGTNQERACILGQAPAWARLAPGQANPDLFPHITFCWEKLHSENSITRASYLPSFLSLLLAFSRFPVL